MLVNCDLFLFSSNNWDTAIIRGTSFLILAVQPLVSLLTKSKVSKTKAPTVSQSPIHTREDISSS